jgi:hypothetical protein
MVGGGTYTRHTHAMMILDQDEKQERKHVLHFWKVWRLSYSSFNFGMLKTPEGRVVISL